MAPDYATCVVSTLLPADSTYNYRYTTYKIKLPGHSHSDPSNFIWKDYVYGSKQAPAYAHNVRGYGGVIRMARCRIPANNALMEWLDQQFRTFRGASWLAAQRRKPQTGQAAPDPQPSATYVCDYWVTISTCDTEGKNCSIFSITCTSYHIKDEQEKQTDPGSGGGGGGFGGPTDDGCTPCSQQPSSEFSPCQDQPGAPTGCTIGGGGVLPPPPPDPCEAANPPDYCKSNDYSAADFLGKIDTVHIGNNPKLKCIFQNLHQGKTMKSVISKFAGEQTNYNLDIVAEPLADSPNGNPRLGTVRPNLDNSSPITIVMNSRYLDRIPTLLLATTLIHEAIHAEMVRKVQSIGGYDNLNSSNFPGLYDFWLRKGQNYQHEEMAAFYLNKLINGVAKYDNNQHTANFYKSLALSELKSTVTWNNLSDDEQQKVDADVDKLIKNGSYSCN